MRKRCTYLISLLGSLTILPWLATPTLADTHYVSKTGSSSPPYTNWTTATDSLRAAIEAANPWDTIRVAAGSYTCDSLLLKKGQVFIGAGMDSTYVQHNGNFFGLLVIADSSVTRGFHFDGIVDTGLAGNLTYRVGDAIGAYTDVDALFTNNRVTNVKGTFLLLFNSLNFPANRMHIDSCEIGAFEQAVDAVGTSTRVTNNVFYLQDSNQASMFRQVGKNAEIWGNRFIKTIERSGNAILDLSPIDTVIIKNNLFVSDSISRGAAVWLNRTDPARVAVGELYNNTIIRGEFGMFTTGNSANPAEVTVHNNLFAHILRSDYGPRLTGDTLVQYNAFWQTNANGIPHDTADFVARNNIFDNPMFADTIAYLFQAFSPGIDAGDPAVLDVDGSRSDIGHAGGPGGFSYVYQDLPPKVPESFKGKWITTGPPVGQFVLLQWRGSHEADFAGYEIHKDSYSASAPDSIFPVIHIASDTLYMDTAVHPGTNYRYRLRAVDRQGNASEFTPFVGFIGASVEDDPTLPHAFALHPNYPNPFNASTQISYALAQPGTVTLTIYDVLGRHVRTLVEGVQAAGEHSVMWHGTNAHGQEVGSGVYFYRLSVGGETEVRKMVVVK